MYKIMLVNRQFEMIQFVFTTLFSISNYYNVNEQSILGAIWPLVPVPYKEKLNNIFCIIFNEFDPMTELAKAKIIGLLMSAVKKNSFIFPELMLKKIINSWNIINMSASP